jgi:hypothetical protein
MMRERINCTWGNNTENENIKYRCGSHKFRKVTPCIDSQRCDCGWFVRRQLFCKFSLEVSGNWRLYHRRLQTDMLLYYIVVAKIGIVSFFCFL